MQNYLLVFLGAGLGGAARHGISAVAVSLSGANSPFGTLAVNVVGSFVMGLLAEWFAAQADPSQGLRLFFTTGLLGGFTTFSAFSLDAVLLYEQGRWLFAALYVFGSVILALAGLAAGMAALRFLS